LGWKGGLKKLGKYVGLNIVLKTKKRKNNYIKSFEVRYGINFNVKRNEKEKFQIIFKNI